MPGLARLRYRFAGLTLECPAKPRRSRVPGIHVLRARDNVDGRVKPGHDGGEDCAMTGTVIRGVRRTSPESISPLALAAQWIPGLVLRTHPRMTAPHADTSTS
ncbi:hypothetical protein CWO90_33710 [Bradyrhizobium sp. Leo121]|nr:hypothetical protein CWO90_33710 [Bradyrhizobium sp. Leo121]